MLNEPKIPKLPDLSSFSEGFKEVVRNIEPPIFKPPQFVTNAEQGIASEFHKRLAKWIQAFDASLDSAHEVGIRLVSFGQAVTFHLESIGHWNPYLISFSGTTEDGDPVELIQHVNQISVLLLKLPRKEPDKPKRKIGFGPCEPELDDGA